MYSTVRFPTATSYRVEVSGWDSEQNFFVEKSELEWSEEAGKHLNLSHALRDRALLFVRLIHPTSIEGSHPVPYQVEPLGETRNGQHGFRLHPIEPKTSGTSSRAA
jgi:hypothetical protein